MHNMHTETGRQAKGEDFNGVDGRCHEQFNERIMKVSGPEKVRPDLHAGQAAQGEQLWGALIQF